MRTAVEGVLAQNARDGLLTVVDDGYRDPGVREWSAAIEDPRVRYHRNARNLGANGNYRRCLEFVEHPHFVVMGADDVMLPNYLDSIHRALYASPDAAIVQPGVEVIDEHGAPSRPLVDRAKRWYAPRGTGLRELRGEQLAVRLLRGDWLYFPSLCWQADALPPSGFRPGLDVV